MHEHVDRMLGVKGAHDEAGASEHVFQRQQTLPARSHHIRRHAEALQRNAHSAHDAVGIIDMILYELGLLVYARETLRALGDRLANHLRLVNQRGHSALCRAQPDREKNKATIHHLKE